MVSLKLFKSERRVMPFLLGSLVAGVILFHFWAFHPATITYFAGEDQHFNYELQSGNSTNLKSLSTEKIGSAEGIFQHLVKSENANAVVNDHSNLEDRINLDTDRASLKTAEDNFIDRNKASNAARIDSPFPSSSSPGRTKQVKNLEAQFGYSSEIQIQKSYLKVESLRIEKYVHKIRGPTTNLSEMHSILLQNLGPPQSVRPRWSSVRDRQLLSVKSLIKNAPALGKNDVYASVFRNVSMFQRSYDLMEHTLKIYVYKEGEKPIFHQPKLRGIYAAEGWFMKLLEQSKRFTVRDPRKAHLFYLPFSTEKLRMSFYQEKSSSIKILENVLENYVKLIKTKHSFWNRTGGADHFFVGCHDWALRMTRHEMSSCIRALCNTNLPRGFSIGKDVSVPVTYIRSGNDPLRDIGGKPPSQRTILAFFAGGMHGYLRPLLLQYWENKFPDMKIFGQMQRDVEGKAVYREYMKSSRYCICARGYDVHTPRVVESIYYECVPVVISDNYVPPFFEVLEWEAFSVFVLEKDIPNLRNILLSIPEERYLAMQHRAKLVLRHFLWHRVPEKYDLFHMILHSVWYNRVFQMKT